MSRYVIGLFFAVLAMPVAYAQIIPGDAPDTGIGAAVRNSKSKPILGISQLDIGKNSY